MNPGEETKPKSRGASEKLRKHFPSLLIIATLATSLVAIFSGKLVVALSETTTGTLTIIGIVYGNTESYPYLRRYMDFTIAQIPNILQNLTFAGFIAIAFKRQPDAVFAVLTLVLVLNMLYLNNQQNAYITSLNTNLSKKTLALKFLVFNHALLVLLFLTFYPLVKIALSA